MNELQKQAMIDFCLHNAGEIKYVPKFNLEGKCTVQEILAAGAAKIRAAQNNLK